MRRRRREEGRKRGDERPEGGMRWCYLSAAAVPYDDDDDAFLRSSRSTACLLRTNAHSVSCCVYVVRTESNTSLGRRV